MGHEYALDWLDQMVSELDPQRTESENFDNYQAITIVEQAAKEEKRLILLFKQFIFQEHKKRQIRNYVNHYLSAAVSLIKTASSNLNQIPARADNFRLALESVLSCLTEVSAFIIRRYKNLVDRDISLSMVTVDPDAQDLRKLANRDVMLNNPELSDLIISAFTDTFVDYRGGEITMRKVDYWENVIHTLTYADGGREISEAFDHLEVIMIERNFNSPLFIKYLTTKFSILMEDSDKHSSVLEILALLQKTFNQIPVMRDMIYNNSFDDLSLAINAWFIQEIDFQSKASIAAIAEHGERSPKAVKKYDRKTSDKVLCNLTVDQLSLFFKAADLSNIISARSLSAIFQTVAPFLSTPNRADISHSSLRVKSYSVEDRDKLLLIEIMTKLTEQIKGL